MTKQSRYSYTTSWAVGRRFRSHRRITPMSRRCAGANLAISVRNWASADRRATADWVLPGTSTSTWTERRPDASCFTLMMAPWVRFFRQRVRHDHLRSWASRTSLQGHRRRRRISNDLDAEHEEMVVLTTFVVNDYSRLFTPNSQRRRRPAE